MEAPTGEPRKREDRGGRVWGGGFLLPCSGLGLGSIVWSPSGARGGAPTANDFKAYFRVTERLWQRETRLDDRSFDVPGPRLWNKLPASLRSSDSHCQFRRQLKTFFVCQGKDYRY